MTAADGCKLVKARDVASVTGLRVMATSEEPATPERGGPQPVFQGCTFEVATGNVIVAAASGAGRWFRSVEEYPQKVVVPQPGATEFVTTPGTMSPFTDAYLLKHGTGVLIRFAAPRVEISLAELAEVEELATIAAQRLR